MWYLDTHTEENIIKNMNRFGYLPQIAEYIGESKSGNYKFSYNMKQLVFSKQGELLSGDVLPRKTKRLRKSEKREKRKTERETFQEDYNRAKPHIEMLLKEDNPLFVKLSLSNQKPSQTEINLIYAKNRDSLEKSLAVYQIPLSFHTDGYEKKDNATFTSYVLRYVKKNLRNIEKAYEKAVKKNMRALYIQEGNTHSYIAHPTQGFYICLKKAEAKIPCQADSSKCFSVEYAGNGLIRTPYIKPAAPAIIKEEMRKTICRKDVCLSSRMYTEVKKYVNRYQQWLDKRIDGYYGVYYLLKMTLDGERCLSFIPLIKKGGSIDSEKHFQRYQKKETGIKQYLELLDLIFEDRSFFCVYQDEVFRFLKKAPKEFKVLVKMRKSIETDKFRLKVYREILKR